MKLDIFEPKQQQWDRYKRPYVQRGAFVEFDTGEMLILDHPFLPANRGVSDNRHITICLSGELGKLGVSPLTSRHIPEPVAMAHLCVKTGRYEDAQMLMLLDYDQGKAYALRGNCTWMQKQIPNELRCMAYYASPFAEPIAPYTQVTQPVRLNPQQRERRKTAVSFAMSLRALRELDGRSRGWAYQYKNEWFASNTAQTLSLNLAAVGADVTKHVGAMSDAAIVQLSEFGLPTLTKKYTVQHLDIA